MACDTPFLGSIVSVPSADQQRQAKETDFLGEINLPPRRRSETNVIDLLSDPGKRPEPDPFPWKEYVL